MTRTPMVERSGGPEVHTATMPASVAAITGYDVVWSRTSGGLDPPTGAIAARRKTLGAISPLIRASPATELTRTGAVKARPPSRLVATKMSPLPFAVAPGDRHERSSRSDPRRAVRTIPHRECG